ncbi:MAG TPA: substrate-binding domain-containing protein [Chloroflexaceae bacterium]|nr:substrate-binding domain-containing protein [Chloroflexaceae bacterium]
MRPGCPLALLAALLLLLAACGAPPAAPPEPQVLRLATTTSTADSGLLEAILPAFEAAHGARVEVIAVGTGQALELGERGDVDVVLVHARGREDAFVEAGYGVGRRDVMYNDFVIVGPPDDPAGIAGTSTARDAFGAIMAAEAPFASRGDDSGTHTKELGIWASVGVTPTQELAWYRSLGQGMGETLIAAEELGAYTLADRATWLATSANLPRLSLLFGGERIDANPDPALYNPYGVIPVSPERHPEINTELAETFAAWLTSPEAQEAIGAFGADTYGQALFFPTAAP